MADAYESGYLAGLRAGRAEFAAEHEEFERVVKPFALGGDYNLIPILRARIAELEKALFKIGDYNTLDGDKYVSHEQGWHGVAEFARKVLADGREASGEGSGE